MIEKKTTPLKWKDVRIGDVLTVRDREEFETNSDGQLISGDLILIESAVQLCGKSVKISQTNMGLTGDATMVHGNAGFWNEGMFKEFRDDPDEMGIRELISLKWEDVPDRDWETLLHRLLIPYLFGLS